MAPKLRVGAAQMAPKFFDKAGTLKKTIDFFRKSSK